jgi:hypothetical protein
MKKKSYKRRPGDFEIRILKDGKVIMIAPDEALMKIAQRVDPNIAISYETEKKENVRKHRE